MKKSALQRTMENLSDTNDQDCVSRKRRKPKLIVESIRRILVLRAVPKAIVAKVSLENS